MTKKKVMHISRNDDSDGEYNIHRSVEIPTLDPWGICYEDVDLCVCPKLFHAAQKTVRLRRGQCKEIESLAINIKLKEKQYGKKSTTKEMANERLLWL